MKKHKNLTLFRKLLALLVAVAIIAGAFKAYEFSRPSDAFALGDLEIDWGVPTTGDPIFTVPNMLPGDVEDRDVIITNNGTTPRPVKVIGERTGGVVELESVLDIVISSGGDIYGGTTGAKTLEEFFTDSAGPAGLFLFDLNPNETKTVNFKVTFDSNAGNEFQNRSVIFDLTISMAFDIPEECSGIEFAGEPIFGTSIGDVLTGTPGNDLIFGLEGGDIINGNNGNDCLVGGSQGDSIRGNNDNDVIIGNEGGDSLQGNNGEDLLIGGEGGDNIQGGNENDRIFGNEDSDTLDGGNGDDYIEGNDGHDGINGGNGNDTILAGAGIDNVDAGAGDDYVEGNEGIDSLRGRIGDDTLIGGADSDVAIGDAGTDKCEAEVETTCELNP